MITITRIIKWHSDKCERTDLKRIGDIRYNSENVNFKLDKSELIDFKRNLQKNTWLSIDLHYIEKL